MFGLSHKINDSGLYLLHDTVEGQLAHNILLLESNSIDNEEEQKRLLAQSIYFKTELMKFEEEITEKRKEYFQFSVEELYYMYGQYDKFTSIEFHKFSEAARKYDRNIMGVFIYGRNERKDLEELINSGNCPRTNGLVKIDVSPNENLSSVKVKELTETGFNSGDIYQILASNGPLVNSYIQEGKKEIPHTISIEFDQTGTDPCKLSLYNSNMRLRHGGKLIDAEWDEYCGYQLYFSPDIRDDEIHRKRIYEADGTIRKSVRFYELVARKFNDVITKEELAEFSALLRARRIERFAILEEELKKTGINSLEKFKADHPVIFREIWGMSLVFHDSVLTYSNMPVPIYWDFRTYLHIYLRHCEELQPAGHFRNKTLFAYTQKDIRRILTRAIEELQDKIQERLTKGLDFRTYGEKALYFNGNYYSLRIESNGRIDSFYPNEYNSGETT